MMGVVVVALAVEERELSTRLIHYFSQHTLPTQTKNASHHKHP